ncbi:MAG: hypothetical protein WA139_00420 [Candidatus Aenigmatarchaeota archaeon]
MHKKSGLKNNNSRNILLLLLVVGVVAVSGCISGGSSNAAGGNGISVTDFASSISEATDCDKSVRLNLDIENRGGKSVPIGETLACLSGKNFPGSTSEQMWAIDSTTSICQSLKKKLDAPDTVKNIPGGTASFKWTVNSPYVPFPLTRTDGFSGRVFYKYASRTSATVFVISEDELAVSKQTGKSMPSAPEIDKTASPVDISIDVAQPVVGNSGDTFTLKVTLSNVGGGTVFDSGVVNFGGDSSSVPSIPEDKLNLITIKVDTSLGAGGDTESGFCNADLKNVELRKGSTVTIPCDIKINTPITNLKSFPILLTASYGYFVDSSEAPMAVSGKKDKMATSCTKGTSSGSIFDFGLSATTATLATGATSATSTITATLNSGTAQSVALTCASGLPAGATCGPVSVTPTTTGATATLTITNTSKISTGTYPITVSGTGGSATKTTSFNYIIP